MTHEVRWGNFEEVSAWGIWGDPHSLTVRTAGPSSELCQVRVGSTLGG